MSNKIPDFIGDKPENIKIIKNRDIFDVFKKIKKEDINIFDKIKELI